MIVATSSASKLQRNTCRIRRARPTLRPHVNDNGAGSVHSLGTKQPRLSSMFSSSKDNSGSSMPPSPTTAPATTTIFGHPMNFGEEFSAVLAYVAQLHFAGLFADPCTVSPLAPTQPREKRRSRSHRAGVNGSVSRVRFHVLEHEQLAEISEVHFSESHESSPERVLHQFPSSKSICTEVNVYSTRTGTTGYTAHTFDKFASSATSIHPPPPQQPSAPSQEILAPKDLSRAMRTLCDLLATSATSAGVVGGLGSAMGGHGDPFAAAQHVFAPGHGVPVNVNTPFLIPSTTPAVSNASLFIRLSINMSGSDELPTLAALVLRSLLHRATSLGEQTVDLHGTLREILLSAREILLSAREILLSAREVQRERLREIEGRKRRQRRERRSSKVSVKSVKSTSGGGKEKVGKRASFLPAQFSRDRMRHGAAESDSWVFTWVWVVDE
ncbi:hypothetical protein BKA62DRAFT_778632 [Auriculariales sp. MPI-PUGE-AT-0066]|nr:hypothetical protein BKA62DRAFT_780290 [Auriculariales sp. MPI-PUGE-AT-0066]KAH7074324.1 hypothetical protein BKA62DRAFT_778632 [Auriculariales sp. MPI-PUGE-AT-0066]